MPPQVSPASIAPSPATASAIVRSDPHLRSRYEEYCRRQAKGLVSLLPRKAIRPLYAQARAWGRERGREVVKDPMATLLLFLEELMPLPPREVWERDRARHLEAHVLEEFDSPAAHRSPSPPVTVASRAMVWDGRRWRATLKVFRRDEAWRGFIFFTQSRGTEEARTAEIFREENPEEIQARFRGFQDSTLQAFLRSVLP